MAVIIDSHTEDNYDAGNYGLYGLTNGHKGQSFTGDGKKINSVEFYLKKGLGSPSGNAYAEIYAHDGTFGTSSVGTGDSLAMSGSVDVSSIGDSYSLIEFDFTGANKITLESGTHYVVVVKYTDGDESNYLHVGADVLSPSHNGNSCSYNGSEWSYGEQDYVFYVYGDIISPLPTFFKQ